MVSKNIDRVSTGVKGLDELIEGGVPKGSVILVSGAPGAGKTILGMQFLEAGLKKGTKCAYVTIEERPEKIVEQAEQFGFFKKAPEMLSAKDVKYDIGWKKPDAIEEKIKLVLEKLKQKKVELVVIDSISSLSLEDGILARRLSRQLIEGLYNIGVTAMITGEALDGDYPDAVTPFLVDGVILIKKIEALDKRSISVSKMRQTSMTLKPQTLSIKKGTGLIVEKEMKQIL